MDWTDEATGHADQIETLYRAHSADAVRLAYLLTGDRARAEDLAHDAFIRVIGRLAYLRNPDAFAGYLRRAVINATRMHFRRRLIEQRPFPTDRGHDSDPQQAADADPVRIALLALPLRQRTAIALRFYYDMSDEQSADVMRCRPGTVRSLISTGVATLRHTLERNE